MRVAILGAGRIARVLAGTMRQMDSVECYAVASRNLKKAEEFAKECGFKKAYGSYEEMLEDDKVELVYIATPHSHHFEHMKLCIEHKKPVLCEKAFTMNAAQAREIKKLANEAGVFVEEAIWTRYMPSRQIINDLLAEGVIGQPSTLTANLSYVISQNERIMAPELAGGALLDVGVYGLNFADMHFGTKISRVESSVQMTETGVDGTESITIFYEDGKMAVILAGIYARSDRKGIIHGDKGYMIIENINNPQVARVYDMNDKLVKEVVMPPQISGYEYEIEECIKKIKAGEIESDAMPLSDSIFVMEQMDEIRRQWGLVYPQEQ